MCVHVFASMGMCACVCECVSSLRAMNFQNICTGEVHHAGQVEREHLNAVDPAPR